MAENQNYSFIGKVEIGTDEYRDLISSMLENKQNYDRARDKNWELERKVSNLEKELATSKANCEKYLEFINSSEEMKTKYKLFLAEKQIKEQEQNDEC